MSNIKVTSFLILILSFYFITTTECAGFDIETARTKVIDVLDYIQRLFGTDNDLELTGYKPKINAAEGAADLTSKANGVLSDEQYEELINMGNDAMLALKNEIDTFTGNYNELLTQANITNCKAPFQDLRAELEEILAKKDQ